MTLPDSNTYKSVPNRDPYAGNGAATGEFVHERQAQAGNDFQDRDGEGDVHEEGHDESWNPIDLGPAWRGEKTRLDADVFQRDDHLPLLLPGINYLFGDSGDGKSLAALIAALQELRKGRHVIWISYEDANEDLIVERLQLLGATEDEVRLLHFFTPDEALGMGAELVAKLAAEHDVRLVVVDSVGEAMAVGGVNEDRDNEVGPWFHQTLRAISDACPRLAVLPIDHSTKSKDNPLFPSGSKRKRAAVSGRSYLLDAGRTPFRRDAVGHVRLVVSKDRSGTFGRGVIAAEITLDATVTPYTVTVKAGRDGGPSDSGGTFRPTVLMERISRHVEINPALSKNAIKEGVRGKNDAKDQAVAVLVSEGFLSVETGPRGAQLHRSAKPYRDDEDNDQ